MQPRIETIYDDYWKHFRKLHLASRQPHDVK